MTPTELEKLKEAAQKANTSVWWYQETIETNDDGSTWTYGTVVYSDDENKHPHETYSLVDYMSNDQAKFIAAFNPTTALKLIEMVEKMETCLQVVLERDWDWDMISGESGMRRIQKYRGRVEELISECFGEEKKEPTPHEKTEKAYETIRRTQELNAKLKEMGVSVEPKEQFQSMNLKEIK